jgi:hypothetical protein
MIYKQKPKNVIPVEHNLHEFQLLPCREAGNVQASETVTNI